MEVKAMNSKTGEGELSFRYEIFELLASESLCDGEIVLTEDQTHFQIHKVIMAACSPYFRAVFTCGMKESVTGKVVIPGVSKDSMAMVVKYAYTNEIEITEENAEVLFSVANRLFISGIQKMCVDLFISRLSVYNCIGIYQFSKFYACDPLAERSWKYILENFALVSKLSVEFLYLTCNELEEMLIEDSLNIREEELAFYACERWIMYDQKRRASFTMRLLQSLRFGSMQPDVLNQIRKESLIEFRHSYLSTFYDDLRMFQNADTMCAVPGNFRPRIPSEVIFITGGYGLDGIVSNIETYDARTDQWFIPLNPPYCPRAYHGTVVLHGHIYIIGGYNINKHYNGVHRFDIATRQWQELSPMHLNRCYVATTALNGRIYACGGYDGVQRHRTVECYHRSTNQWVLVAPMRSIRSDAGIASLKGKLYVCGGFDGRSSLNSMEVYNARRDQWTLLENMSTYRTGLSVVCMNFCLYVIGGFNGQHRLRSVEKYNVHLKRWSRVTPMLGRRSNFAATVLEGFIYVIGGYDGDTVISTVECYDPLTRTWNPRANLLFPRSALSSTTVMARENSRYFTYYGQQKDAG